MTKCLIIDDELPARALIKTYLGSVVDFEVLGSFNNAIDGLDFLKNNCVDLIFLDIQMPQMTGLALLKSLEIKPKVVFTTAYREFAADAFDLEALDYLVKPISEERFMKTISKFLQLQEYKQNSTPISTTLEEAYIFLKVGKEQKKVFLSDILYIEGLKDYIKVYTNESMLVVYERLGYMEAKLPESRFVRIHKSFIISIDKILTYSNDTVRVKSQEIPIGRIYKQGFMSCIEQFKL
ncbi:DNA-binding response regulator [Lacihabitans sp. CCS-44]|uniref:LytR/AlgR family response regulator transcription factor n=1 Tax=Lacihabitans sp. CCS-44 TaxID=2487331 RepID=UPI0020CE2546|nr:LytTR family DNA-binding domain-containing protein [Lacihabitans sp. CCS-44]MCP9757179.1 DNA-binding response regulator [Lacihabitans sp. CCS-44]